MLQEVLWPLRVRRSRGPDSKQGGGGEKGQIMKTLEKHTHTHTHTHTQIGRGRSGQRRSDRQIRREKTERKDRDA